MLNDAARWMSPDVFKIVLVFFLSFLVGLEREEQKGSQEGYSFGGVRTFPLIGLLGFAVALLSGSQILPVAVGFAVVGSFLIVSYVHKLRTSSLAGATSEISALATYLIGALVCSDHYWTATTLAVISLLLLELKVALESLARRTAPGEILAAAKFLLLTGVILPILPDTAIGPFHLNPFRIWLVVVAVSAVSYASYVLQKATRGRGGIVVAAVLGGAYSSTATTAVLARRARREPRCHVFSGGILIASGMMYVRLIVLLALFNGALLAALGPAFALLAVGAIGAGMIVSRLPDGGEGDIQREYVSKNPLELGTAMFFALLFIVMLVATQLAVVHVGQAGVYGLAAVMGVADVDPFIMGMTQAAGGSTPVTVAAIAILITAVSNNVIKGIYAFAFADRRTGVESLVLLILLAACGLLPLLTIG